MKEKLFELKILKEYIGVVLGIDNLANGLAKNINTKLKQGVKNNTLVPKQGYQVYFGMSDEIKNKTKLYICFLTYHLV